MYQIAPPCRSITLAAEKWKCELWNDIKASQASAHRHGNRVPYHDKHLRPVIELKGYGADGELWIMRQWR